MELNKKILIINTVFFLLVLISILFLDLINWMVISGTIFYTVFFLIMFTILFVSGANSENKTEEEEKNKSSLAYCWNRINHHLSKMEGMTLSWGKGINNQTTVKAYNDGKNTIYFRAVIAKISKTNIDILIVYNITKDEISRYEKPKTEHYSDLFYDYKPFEKNNSDFLSSRFGSRYPYKRNRYLPSSFNNAGFNGGFGEDSGSNDSTTDFSDDIHNQIGG